MSLRALLERRGELNALLKRHGASVERVYLCVSSHSRVGFKVKQRARTTDARFEALDAIARRLPRMGFRKIRRTASGFEFAAGVTLGTARTLELAHQVVVTWERFFAFWAIHEPFRILSDAEQKKRGKALRYREISVDGGQLVVDNLQSASLSRTVENALDELYREGNAKDLRTLLAMLTPRR